MKLKYFTICFAAILGVMVRPGFGCEYKSPAALAKAAWQLKDGLLSHPEWQSRHLALPLRQLLAAERKCSQQEVCAIDEDIWTGAQDGEPYGPVVFRAQPLDENRRVVKISYRFGFGPDDRHKSARYSLINIAHSPQGCWEITDISANGNGSLLKQLQDYYHQ